MGRRSKLAIAGFAIGFASVLASERASVPASAADHKESPLARIESAADINDIYAFLDPNDASQLVLAMTVNPFVAPPSNEATAFSTNVVYRFNIDRDADAREDLVYEIRFGALSERKEQQITVNGVPAGLTTALSVGSSPRAPVVTDLDVDGAQHTIFAGLREDPFFFDLVGTLRWLSGFGSGVTFPRTPPVPDSFAGLNTSALVLRAPVAFLRGGTPGTRLGIWATTEIR